MAHNIPPVKVTPYVFIREFGSSSWSDIGANASAQCIYIEQRPGASFDQCLIRLPTKRLEYFNTNDADWPISHFDECLVSFSGNVHVFGTIRNWIRRWQGNDEVVEFMVLNMDQFHDDVCQGQVWGSWNTTDNTNVSTTKASIPTAQLIFNKDGNPNYNKMETNYDHTQFTVGGPRFWGTGHTNDTTAGWWNPITELMYLDQNVWSYGGGFRYRSLVTILGSVASTGGWSGEADGADNLTWQKPFPELNVEGLTYGQAIEKLWKQAGGFQYYAQTAKGGSAADMRIFRTYPPYTSHQTIKDFYLPSFASPKGPLSANSHRGRLNKDDSRRITHLIGYGAHRRYIGTVKLQAGWDAGLTADVLADTDLIDRSKRDTYDPKYQDVMRRWILPRSTSDLNTLFGFSTETPYSRDVHTFEPTTKVKYTGTKAANDDKPEYLKPLVAFVSFGGSDVYKIDSSVQLLPDALGIYLGGTGGKLEDQAFIAHTSGSNGGTLNDVYVTAVIESNARLVSSQTDSKIALGTVPDIQRTVEYPGEFKLEARAPSMGDYSTGGNRRILMQIPGETGIIATTLSQFKSVNDQSGLDQRTLDEYKWRNTSVDNGFINIGWIESTYEIGNIAGSVNDRAISISGVIVGRRWSFENQTTTLQFSDEAFRRR